MHRWCSVRRQLSGMVMARLATEPPGGDDEPVRPHPQSARRLANKAAVWQIRSTDMVSCYRGDIDERLTFTGRERCGAQWPGAVRADLQIEDATINGRHWAAFVSADGGMLAVR